MSNIWKKLVEGIFAPKDVVPTKPFVVPDNASYFRWLTTESGNKQIQAFYQHCAAVYNKQEQGNPVALKSPYANGIQYYLAAEQAQKLHFIARWTTEKLAALGYLPAQNSVKTDKEGNKTYRFYQKPQRLPGEEEHAVWQGYGNVLIEITHKGTALTYKLMGQVYSDRNYDKALPFEALLEQLCD
jgi:hypothetical protein